MPKRIITELKEFFMAGKRPTEKQFEDVLDSYVHVDNPEFVKSEDVASTREGILKFFTTDLDPNADKICHIKLPYKANTDRSMYHLKATGYDYSGSDIIDITWVGYCYEPLGNLVYDKTHVNASTTITAGQYVGTDSHVYLWFKPANTYFLSFKLDSMRVGNGTLLKENDVQLILSNELHL